MKALLRNSGLLWEDILAKQAERYERTHRKSAQGGFIEAGNDDAPDEDSDDSAVSDDKEQVAVTAPPMTQAAQKKQMQASLSFKLLCHVVDPMRQVLSAGKPLYFPMVAGQLQAVRGPSCAPCGSGD
jgi:hypothetical protein